MLEIISYYANFHTLALFFAALVLGAMMFFAAVVTPTVFRALPDGPRTQYLSALFPVYYRNLAFLSILAGGFIWYRAESYWLWAVAVLFLFADIVLRPLIEKYRAGRDAGDAAAKRTFGLLHRASVLINLAQMGIMIVVFFRLAV